MIKYTKKNKIRLCSTQSDLPMQWSVAVHNKNVRLCASCEWLWNRTKTSKIATATTTNMQEKCLCLNSQTDKKTIAHSFESITSNRTARRIVEFKTQMSTWLACLCVCVWFVCLVFFVAVFHRLTAIVSISNQAVCLNCTSKHSKGDMKMILCPMQWQQSKAIEFALARALIHTYSHTLAKEIWDEKMVIISTFRPFSHLT